MSTHYEVHFGAYIYCGKGFTVYEKKFDTLAEAEELAGKIKEILALKEEYWKVNDHSPENNAIFERNQEKSRRNIGFVDKYCHQDGFLKSYLGTFKITKEHM